VAVIREYVDACGNRRGLFDSTPRKFLKVAAMAAIASFAPSGAAALGVYDVLGAVLTGVPASTVAHILDASVELGLGVIETFIIENLKVGWTPRAYFDGLRKLRREDEKRH
jgi:hypothetical protein